MSIVKIVNNAITEIMPLNQPIDDSWRYVYDFFPENFDPKYQTYSYNFTYDSNTDQVTSTANISYLPLNQVKSIRLDELADTRWNHQIAGMDFNGVFIQTDDTTALKILGCRVAVDVDPTLTFKWKTPAGFVELNHDYIVAISDGVRGHIQACFDNENFHLDAIDALTTPEEVINYDLTTGWPS